MSGQIIVSQNLKSGVYINPYSERIDLTIRLSFFEGIMNRVSIRQGLASNILYCHALKYFDEYFLSQNF